MGIRRLYKKYFSNNQKMKLFALFMPLILAQAADPVDERLVNFNRLPRVFEWYKTVIGKFVRGKFVGKYQHRIDQLYQKIVWETERCPKAGPTANQNKNGRFADEDNLILDDFEKSIAELEQMMSDDKFLVEVSKNFEYEENDDLYTPDDQSSGRKIGNRPTKPGKDTEWKATTMTGMDFDFASRPPRVLVYRLNKTLIKWFNDFMPAECRKFTRIYKRMKGLKMQITKLMPKHQWQFEA